MKLLLTAILSILLFVVFPAIAGYLLLGTVGGITFPIVYVLGVDRLVQWMD